MASTLRQSSIHSLHRYLNNVYAPLLFGELEDSNKKDSGDNQLRDLLYSFKAGLKKSLRKGRQDLVSTDFNPNEFRGILSLKDEIECWADLEKELVSSQGDERLRQNAEAISKHFSKIAGPVNDMHNLDLGQITGLIQDI